MILDILKALADNNRLRILYALSIESELCACQVTELLEVTGATVSRHIKQLIDAGLVSSRKDGKWVYYKLKDNHKNSLCGRVLDEIESENLFSDDIKRLAEVVSCDKNELCRKVRK